MNIYQIKKINIKKNLYIIFIATFLCLTACNKEIKNNINESSGNSNHQTSTINGYDISQFYSIDYNVAGLSLIIPDEWINKYIVDKSGVVYFNGENEYSVSTVSKTCFMALSEIGMKQSIPFLDIVTVPKDEIMGYLNWGMNDAQFFLGFNNDYYFFSSGTFGLLNKCAFDEELEIFSSEIVETTLQDSLNYNSITTYWKNPLLDIDTLHGRNDELPFEMNIQFIYDIQGSYKYVDESGKMPTEDVINNLLQEFTKDLYTPSENRRFTIRQCEVLADTIYNEENMELLADNINLKDYYINGGLDKYLTENCWIVTSRCKVYDFQGFLSMINSREFHEINLDYIGADAGVWIVIKSGNNYDMFRPDIPYISQDS